MVILTADKLDDVPKGAVLMNEDEALVYQWDSINEWKNGGVWSLKYGAGILGSLSGCTGVYINHHYRTKLRLRSFGAFSTYLPIVILPALLTTLYHKVFIQPHILLKKEKCPVCLTVRASFFQTLIGVAYPTILAPFASYMFATRHFTYRLPSITENPKQLFTVYKKMTTPLTMFISAALAVHTVVAMTLTRKEILDYYRLEQEMIRNQELSSELSS